MPVTLAPYWSAAVQHLQAVDVPLGALITRIGVQSCLSSRGEAFHTLARCVVGQQISVAAADRLWERLEHETDVNPQRILDHPDLRTAVGLSRSKAQYLENIARFILSHQALSAENLLAIKGIGPWSVDMFRMFHLLDSDVLPVGDLGFIKGYRTLYGLGAISAKALIASRHFQETTARWHPYCSAATWYLWRSVENTEITY